MGIIFGAYVWRKKFIYLSLANIVGMIDVKGERSVLNGLRYLVFFLHVSIVQLGSNLVSENIVMLNIFHANRPVHLSFIVVSGGAFFYFSWNCYVLQHLQCVI